MENLEVSKAVLAEINKLFEKRATCCASDIPMHKIEMDILHQLLQIGRSFLEHIVEEKLVQLKEQDFDMAPKIQQGTKNQLTHYANLGILKQLPAIATVRKSPVWNDPSTGSLHGRALAYLDMNCAHCHREGGPRKYFCPSFNRI